MAEFQKILEDRPGFVAARVHLGVTLYSMGRAEEALKEWTEVLRLDPANKSCQMYINLVKEEEGG